MSPSPMLRRLEPPRRDADGSSSTRTDELDLDARKRRLFHDLVVLLARAIDAGEDEGPRHSRRVAVLGGELARTMRADVGLVFYGGLLHDIGTLYVRRRHVAMRAEADASFARSHAARGAGLVRPLRSLASLEPVLAHHHERWDGSGFPYGLTGAETPAVAALVSLADLLEGKLRRARPEDRAWTAATVTLDLRDTAVPAEACEGMLRLLARDPEIVADLFDEAALDRRLAAFEVEPPGLDRVSTVELVAELLWLLARAIDAKHAHVPGHSARVALASQRIAARLGADVDRWDVVCAALLHDVGKLFVAEDALVLDGVDDQKSRAVREHARHTERVVASLGPLAHLALAASSHHEAFDGSGYPSGLAGEAIPLVARIVAYADLFDELLNDPEPRGGSTVDQAIASMRGVVGEILDPALADGAFEVLTHGADLAAASDDLLGFQNFFRSAETRVARRLPKEEARPSDDASDRRWVTVITDEAGVIVEGADELARLTGERSSRVVDHVVADGLAELLDELARARRGETLSASHLTPSAKRLELVLARLRGGAIVHARAAQETWRSIQELAFVHRNFLLSSEAVLFTDARARILDVNYAFTRMFGWRAQEVIGKTPKILQSGLHGPAVYRAMRESLADPHVGAWSGELTNKTKSGDFVVVQLTVNSVRDASGRVVGFVSNAVDVTARRRAQEALEARERDLVRKNAELEQLSQFKSQIVAITSHDLRSSLASIIGLAELLREAPSRDAGALANRLGMIADLGHGLVRLVNDLLDLDRCERGALTVRRRRVFAEGVARAVANTPAGHERVVVTSSEPALTVLADPDRLEQALQNLVQNALKFAPADSKIELACERVDGGKVAFRVEDRGPGIPAASLEAVFDRYYQVDRGARAGTRGAGVGLGLAIVKHIAELHGGRAHAENREGGGSRFVVEIPGAPRGGKTPLAALLVGPPTDDLEHARRFFEGRGFLIESVDRSREVARRAAIEAPDVLVVDARRRADLDDAVIERARATRAALVLVGEDADAIDDPKFAWKLASPVMDLELSAVERAARASAGRSLA